MRAIVPTQKMKLISLGCIPASPACPRSRQPRLSHRIEALNFQRKSERKRGEQSAPVIIWTWAALSQQSADNLDIRHYPMGRRDVLVGLFVDDGSLALAIIVIVLLSPIFTTLMPDLPFCEAKCPLWAKSRHRVTSAFRVMSALLPKADIRQ